MRQCFVIKFMNFSFLHRLGLTVLRKEAQFFNQVVERVANSYLKKKCVGTLFSRSICNKVFPVLKAKDMLVFCWAFLKSEPWSLGSKIIYLGESLNLRLINHFFTWNCVLPTSNFVIQLCAAVLELDCNPNQTVLYSPKATLKWFEINACLVFRPRLSRFGFFQKCTIQTFSRTIN